MPTDQWYDETHHTEAQKERIAELSKAIAKLVSDTYIASRYPNEVAVLVREQQRQEMHQ